VDAGAGSRRSISKRVENFSEKFANASVLELSVKIHRRMIKVENLTKRYAGQTAIDNLNFEVGKGEIMGFLGPNGAGKSTTMRILSSFMPPTSGRASIAGFDIFDKSLQARARLGYMPENVPLYNDMRVTEYLDYRAALKGVPRRRINERVGDVKELCGLKEVEKKLIGALSKGYRQRVGLADALVHEPDLLILDEPTSGLDPNQIRQVRELIKNLGRQHTILLSTHILPEVEMTCSRIIIINRGRIEACDTPENLLNQMRTATGVVLEAKTGNDNGIDELKKIAGVKDVTLANDADWQIFSLRAEAGADVRPEVFRLASERRWAVRELSQRKATLEDVFVEITHADEV
jgi:ABC-2 type transport system ATP-binding protein